MMKETTKVNKDIMERDKAKENVLGLMAQSMKENGITTK